MLPAVFFAVCALGNKAHDLSNLHAQGASALHYAAYTCDLAWTRTLLEAGEEAVLSKLEVELTTPLHLICTASCEKQAAIITAMATALAATGRPQLELANNKGRTPLFELIRTYVGYAPT